MFQAESVGDAAFGCDWVGTPIQFQRCLIFFIARAKKEFHLTAGKFVPVSNSTMTNVGKINILCSFLHGSTTHNGPGLPPCWGFVITLRHTTSCSTPLDKRSDRRADLYLITHNTYTRPTFMTSAEFEPAIPAIEQPQRQALDRMATGMGFANTLYYQ